MAVFSLPRLVGFTAALLALAVPAHAADEPRPRVVRTQTNESPADPTGPGHPLYHMRLTLAVLSGAGWNAREVLAGAETAARILAKCGIRTPSIELAEVDGPDRYRTLFTPVSRRLAAELGLPKPTVFFLADTRHRPAFDAEAIGRGNSRTRPEMADTVWIVRGTRDLEAVIAHELAHVLGDSGEHSDEPGNLMREETAPDGTRLTPAQCDKIVKTGIANGLLQPLRP